MQRAVGPCWIVGLPLVLAADEWNDYALAKLVTPLSALLMTCKQAVKLFDVARRQVATSIDEGKDALNRVFLIAYHRSRKFRFLRRSVGNQGRVYTLLNHQLRDSAIERIELFDEAGLDRPLSFQALGELLDGQRLAQLGSLLNPNTGEGCQLLVGKLLWIDLVVVDVVPVLGHDQSSRGRLKPMMFRVASIMAHGAESVQQKLPTGRPRPGPLLRTVASPRPQSIGRFHLAS